MKKSVLDELVEILIDKFSNIKITKGNKHAFLGMNTNMLEGKKIEIDIVDQLKEIVEFFESNTGETLSKERTIPTADHVFPVNPNVKQLDNEKSKVFHSIKQKLLHAMKRARPDIEIAMLFLMRRVSKSDEDDWKKLKRVLSFIKSAINEKRIIGAESLTEIINFIDASHTVHDNFRSHMGGLISLGLGITLGKSAMEKLNAKSTCESELIGTAEYLPCNL